MINLDKSSYAYYNVKSGFVYVIVDLVEVNGVI